MKHMQIYNDLTSMNLPNYTVCGIGNFDGVHKGHQELIKKLLCTAKEKYLDSLILTFEPHPLKVLSPNSNIKLITTLEQKKKIMRSYGIDHFVLAPFTDEFSKIDYTDFIYDILIKKCRAKVVVVGYNYRFGYKGRGTAEALKEICGKNGIDTIIIPQVTYNGYTVSSTLIRELIEKGDVKTAAELLGRPFTIEGIVKPGNSIGKKIGFPTANIAPEENIVLPPKGVYAVLARRENNVHTGIANLGVKPTFNGSNLVLEVHLFDFNRELYGENLEIMFIERLRPEFKFATVKDLVRQIQQDILQAKEIFKINAVELI